MKEKLQQLKNSVEEFLSDSKTLNASELRSLLLTAAEGLNEICQFDDLKTLLDSSDWPSAVFQVQIADENSEKDKEERAEGIADIILPNFNGKKFLDFGCGEGHVAKHAASNATLSVGYDIERSTKSQLAWEDKKENLLLTTNFETVRSEGPYDIILIYDVLDHAKDESMSEILARAKSVLSEDGSIYLRCHPWCGRHGGHAYRKINKAFVHLVLTEDELKEVGLDLEPTQKVLFPLVTYSKAIEDAGLIDSQERDIDFQDVEPFFSENPIVKNRILKVFGIEKWGKNEKPAFQMSQCFVDYVLKKRSDLV
jgi:2-polyprenyl-3-methyl-5-hydroxy-6-metoxy-1,4-benzoquinol methylase